MIITRTPFRISFVGGGTDLKSFYSKEPGQVLSTSINKYIYVVIKRQIGIVEHKYRVNWSKVEFKETIEDIEHPIVREALIKMEIDFPVEITTFTDIPGQTGLGSSSSFAVGLMHALYAMKGVMVTKHHIASEAAEIEVEKLKRVMGKQDHFAASYGDMNVLTFLSNEEVIVDPVVYRPEIRGEIENNILLFYTRVKRDASKVLKSQNIATAKKREVLRKMKDLVPELREILASGINLNRFGEILHESWVLKRSITEQISNNEIDEYYKKARNSGALGGKLLGAGGGGFLLFYVEPQNQARVIESLKDLYHMQVGFDSGGSRITYYDQNNIT